VTDRDRLFDWEMWSVQMMYTNIVCLWWLISPIIHLLLLDKL